MTLTLYQFPLSHYCEKARFALAHKHMAYQTVNLVPGLHLKTMGALAQRTSVPALVTGDARVVQGSAHIITYLDDVMPERRLTPTAPVEQQEALEWESWLDRGIGVDVRRYCYHHLLPDRQLTSEFLTAGCPWYGRLFLRLSYGRLVRVMRKVMDINEDSAAQSLVRIEAAIDRLADCYSTRAYLVGNQFTRADLAAAVLLAPIYQPEGYGMRWPDRLPPTLEETAKAFAPRLTWAQRLYCDYRC